MFYYLLAGLIIGVVGTLIWSRRKTYGTVIVYFPDDPSESPYLGLKVDRGANDICTKNRIQFKVQVEHLNSQN